MPRRIVIVGGGVIGTAVAWRLARAEAGEVTLLERDRLGSGTTWHSAGNITWKPISIHDEAVLYVYEAIETLEAAGIETGWLRTGRMFVSLGAETRHHFERFDAVARERGIGARWLEKDEARRLNPLINADAVEGIWLNPMGGHLDPAGLTAAYAASARKPGARIRESCGASAIATRGGRASGVVTKEGVVEADIVVVAAGLWSRGLLIQLGVHLAQWPCEHFYLIADVKPRLPRTMPSFVAPDILMYGREEVGGLMVGFFDEDARTIDPASLPEPFSFTLLEPAYDKIEPYLEGACRVFPVLAEAPVRKFINGPESFTPDGAPLVGAVAGIEGLIVATAMNSIGVSWSAMVGDIVTRLVKGAEQRFEAARFEPGRFGERGKDLPWLRRQVSDAVSLGYRNQNK
jgi:4-methylaminobutanoate oxidase (formaldehyde-forming)